jgi:hypothetical protein
MIITGIDMLFEYFQQDFSIFNLPVVRGLYKKAE